MVNYNSPIVQNMINNGQFGYNSPMANNQQFNPYSNTQFMNPPIYSQPSNIVSFGSMNYNQQTNNNYSFKPVNGGFDMGYNQQYSPYQQNGYYQQNYYGYQPYGYNQYNNYGSNYGELSPFLFSPNPVQQQQASSQYYGSLTPQVSYQDIRHRQMGTAKLKASIVNSYFGTEYDPKKIEQMYIPKDDRTAEEIKRDNEYNKLLYWDSLFRQPAVGALETEAMRTAKCIADMSRNFHEQFDNVGLCEFLEEHLWKFQREEWIRKNIDIKSRRDLSRIYSIQDYNELLKLHKSSTNPYLNDLLDNTKYDNNLDDMEIGLPSVLLDAERRKRNILEGKVPTYISSPETQKQREGYMNMIMEQVYSKRGRS